MNVFDELQSYSEWSDRLFTCEEIASVKEAIVCEGLRGKSIKFTMKTGGVKYISIDLTSQNKVEIGTVVPLADLILREYIACPKYYRVVI